MRRLLPILIVLLATLWPSLGYGAAAATSDAVYNPAPVARFFAAARQSRAAFGGAGWDSNGQWPDQQSGTNNHGRRYGHLVGMDAIGLDYKGFLLTPSRSETNARYASGFTATQVPYTFAVNLLYGENRYDTAAASFPPANILVFADHEANGSPATFHERLHPLDYRWFPNGDAVEATLGRVAPIDLTLRSTCRFIAHNLRYRIFYADGTDDSADGASNRAQFKPTFRIGTTEYVGSTVNANTGAIATAYADHTLAAGTGDRTGTVLLLPGNNATGTVKGPLMLLGYMAMSDDDGHVMNGVLYSIAGATTAHVKAAVTNASDEMIAWWMQEMTRPMGGADATLLLEICLGVNDEAASYTSIKADTTAIVNRLRGVWTGTLGRPASRLPFLLSVPQPMVATSNETEANFILGLGAQYREIARGLDATVYDATLTATAADYQTNSWNHTGDTLNHHLSVTGYEQHHTIQWQSLDTAVASFNATRPSKLSIGLGIGLN